MILHLAKIEPGSSLDGEWSVEEKTVQTESQDILLTKLDLKYSVQPNKSNFVMHYELTGSYSATCERCGEPLKHKLEGGKQRVLLSREQPDEALVHLGDRELDTSFIEDDQLDLDSFVDEAIWYALPDYIRHSAEEPCQALEVDEGDLPKENPFAALKDHFTANKEN